MLRLTVAIAVFLAFTGWSTWISYHHGYWGFLDVALDGEWGSQVFVDLAIGIFLLVGFLRPDAKKRGLPYWPYVVAVPFLGSISPLAYMVHREWAALRQKTARNETEA